MHTTCLKNVIGEGRLGKGIKEQTFTAGKEYTFCYNSKNNDLFTKDDVAMMHFFKTTDDIFIESFTGGEPVKIEDAGLSEFEEAYYSRMFKERHAFMDTPEIEHEEGEF